MASAGNVVLGADQAVIDDRSTPLTQWSEPIAGARAGQAPPAAWCGFRSIRTACSGARR